MFEIGNSLREARLRQGIDLARAEADTKIRGKYLQALENERFDVLPGETYVKGFLRTYAEYLGLDGQLYVDEFSSRFASAEDVLLAPAAGGRPRGRATDSSAVVVTLAAIVAVTVLVVVAWRFGTTGEPTEPDVNLGPQAATTTTGAATTGAAEPGKRQRSKQARLVLTARRGDCWLVVRAGSATGEQLYQGTLERGQSQRFVRKRLWITAGAGEMLRVRLNGKRVRFPTGTSTVLVTAKGVRTISAA